MRFERKTVQVTPGQYRALLKMAFDKSAKSDNGASPPPSTGTGPDSKDNLKNTSIGAIIGALMGSGLGYLNYKRTPKDKEEDDRKKLWSHVLGGAALGGVAGAGLGYYKVPSRVSDALKSLISQEPTSNEKLVTDTVSALSKTELATAPAGALAGELAGRAIGTASDLAADHPRVAAVLDRRGRGSIKNVAGIEQNPLHEYDSRVQSLREMRAKTPTFKMPAALEGVAKLRELYPGNISELASNPVSSAAIAGEMRRLGLVTLAASDADAVATFGRMSKVVNGIMEVQFGSPTWVQDAFSGRGRYGRIGAHGLGVLGAFLGWNYAGSLHGSQDTGTPQGNRSGR